MFRLLLIGLLFERIKMAHGLYNRSELLLKRKLHMSIYLLEAFVVVSYSLYILAKLTIQFRAKLEIKK